MSKLKEIVSKIGIYRLLIIVLCLFSIIGLFMPYEKSIGDKKDYLISNSDDYYLKEVNLKNKDVVNISIVENFKVYNYAKDNSDGNAWLHGEALLNFIITISLVLSIVAILISVIFKKYILSIIFDIIMVISSLLMNADIVSRGVIPTESYTFGISYYIFIIFSIIIFVLAIIARINKNKEVKN